MVTRKMKFGIQLALGGFRGFRFSRGRRFLL
jgi:hypothetical protein